MRGRFSVGIYHNFERSEEERTDIRSSHTRGFRQTLQGVTLREVC